MRIEILDASGNPTEVEPRFISHTLACQFLLSYIRTSDQVLKADHACVDITYPDFLEFADYVVRRTKNGEPHIYRLTPADDPVLFESLRLYAENSARTLPRSDTKQ